MESIYIQQWDEEKLMSSGAAWSELLLRSNSDQLFLSWEWQSSWWKIFSDPDHMELRLYAATSKEGRLLGLAPLFCTKAKTRKILTTKRLQFIGNMWRGRTTMLTELLDFIVDNANSKEIIRALCEHISTLKDWDEFVLPFQNVNSDTYRILVNDKQISRCYIRHAQTYNSYYLGIKGEFDGYIKSLGKNTRLKLFNRRKMFEELEETSFSRMQSDNINRKFELLNHLHEKRWGSPIFEGKRLEFNISVAELMAKKNCLNFSILTASGIPVSIQYNYVVNQNNYNIQAGFDESFHKKISLGYLHFGYEIQASYHDKHNAYDFLAGEGKNTQYKERLTSTYLRMTDLQIIRSPLLKLIYRVFNGIEKLKQAKFRMFNT